MRGIEQKLNSTVVSFWFQITVWTNPISVPNCFCSCSSEWFKWVAGNTAVWQLPRVCRLRSKHSGSRGIGHSCFKALVEWCSKESSGITEDCRGMIIYTSGVIVYKHSDTPIRSMQGKNGAFDKTVKRQWMFLIYTKIVGLHWSSGAPLRRFTRKRTFSSHYRFESWTSALALSKANRTKSLSYSQLVPDRPKIESRDIGECAHTQVLFLTFVPIVRIVYTALHKHLQIEKVKR